MGRSLNKTGLMLREILVMEENKELPTIEKNDITWELFWETIPGTFKEWDQYARYFELD